MHVQVDITGEPAFAHQRWTDEAANAFIDRAIAVTGLQPFGIRQVGRHAGVLMFIQLIAQSHISGHLDAAHGAGWVDVFSCRSLDVAQVVAAVRQHLLLNDAARIRVLERGPLFQEERRDGISA